MINFPQSSETNSQIFPQINSNSRRYDLPLQLNGISSKSRPKPKKEVKKINFQKLKFHRKEAPSKPTNNRLLANHNKSECPSFRNMHMQSKIQKQIKGMMRSQSVKERIELKNAKLYLSENNTNKSLKRGVSSYLNNKNMNAHKSRALLNLENAIKNYIPSVKNHKGHHLSTEQSQPIMIAKILKENIHPNVTETANILNQTKLG